MSKETWIVLTADTKDRYRFKKDIEQEFPDAKIDWSDEKPDFCSYLIRLPSIAMARRFMIFMEDNLKAKKSSHWVNKFYHFYDDETGETIEKIWSSTFYCRSKHEIPLQTPSHNHTGLWRADRA